MVTLTTMIKSLIITVLLYLSFMVSAVALPHENTYADNASYSVSLLTCSPGEDLYSMFGHSGIRLRNNVTGEDLVFNYGMFNYDVDNFIFQFVRGETDYELGVEYAEDFFWRYGVRKHGVVEQELDLTDKQKRKLVLLLYDNYRPENRVYRYNFLYDNCTTRARDVIEKAVSEDGGGVEYLIESDSVSFRTILHGFTGVYPWVEFGIDMLLGAEVDRIANRRESMFIPSYYKKDVDGATVVYVDGTTCGKRLVKNASEVLTDKIVHEETSFLLTPIFVFWFMFAAVLIISVIDIRRCRSTWWVDLILLTVQGLAGVIIAFLFFFSEHPAVGTNWLVVVFNPLPLLLMFWIINSRRKCQPCWLSTAYLAVMSLFVLSIPFIPQVLNPAMIPLVLILLLRALSGEIVVRRRLGHVILTQAGKQ